ncbi:hypothetical protein HanXRQr2_Chr16g0766351 [Helianthus annuus]|uniref:Uncharacterized protein n=1 Tax=Helianthus annuus TaxID=4232 RepID=A0A251S266_HELAN|nr:hypothetical protein HanXRQr2_Chr16g0766351 [Helianthus annuus]KAJ0822645.1 hypothetical protein HanPSC8_Chr16g0734521 [Helianthus annuus]
MCVSTRRSREEGETLVTSKIQQLKEEIEANHLHGSKKKVRVTPDRKRITTKVKLLDGWHHLDRTHL